MHASHSGALLSRLALHAHVGALSQRQREFCIDNLLVRIHFII